MIELRECPFCGGPGELVERHNPMSKWKHSVDCSSPTCVANGPVEATRTDAVTAWNTRAPGSAMDGELVRKLRAKADACERVAQQMGKRAADASRRGRPDLLQDKESMEENGALYRAAADALAAQPVGGSAVGELNAQITAFEDFINHPPEYEREHRVCDYRHELWRRWEPISRRLSALAHPASAAEGWIDWKPEMLFEARLCNGSIERDELCNFNLSGEPPNGPTTIVAIRPAPALSTDGADR